jgi:hypothetical protein
MNKKDKKIEEIKEQIKDYQEYKLFFLSEECNSYINVSTELLQDSDMNDEEKNTFFNNSLKVRRIRIALSDTLEKRFGFPVLDDVGKVTDGYLEWFKKWNDWRFSFEDEEWLTIETKIIKGDDIKEYLPDEN